MANPADSGGGHPVPFFIMGSPRSGTTLVAQILDAHSRLSVYFEMSYHVTFRPLARLYGDLGDERNRRRFVRDVLDHLRVQRAETPSIGEVEQALVAPTFEGILETLLGLQARQQDKLRGGEKTPLNYLYLDDIRSGFPDSPVIYLMRDPRDVVLSMRKAWNMSNSDATRVWNQAYLKFAQGPSAGVHLVRYEQLVREPAATTEAICRALGESFEPEMVATSRRVPKQLEAIRHLDLTKLGGAVVTSSVGNYKELGGPEIREIEAACAMGMEAMGYEFTGPAPEITPPVIEGTGFLRHAVDRLRYLGHNPERWRRGLFRWRMALMVRLRYVVRLGFRRPSPR